ncbi:MAG: outer spore coat protein CotE [Bacilli bacterium]
MRGDIVSSYKEIVTKAIVGKGKKYFKNNYSVSVGDKPTTVLGCWIINHKFKGYKSGDKIGVDGAFDVNIWYSYDNDSKTTVANQKFEYNDLFNVKVKENSDLTGDTEIIVRTLKQPICSKVEVKDGVINFDVEKELGVEIVGETKFKIGVEDDEEPWEELNDEVNETIEKEIENSVDENYI